MHQDGKTQVFKDVHGQLKTGLAECQKVTKYCNALNDMVIDLRKESNITRDERWEAWEKKLLI